jgi:hypothetical protein
VLPLCVRTGSAAGSRDTACAAAWAASALPEPNGPSPCCPFSSDPGDGTDRAHSVRRGKSGRRDLPLAICEVASPEALCLPLRPGKTSLLPSHNAYQEHPEPYGCPCGVMRLWLWPGGERCPTGPDFLARRIGDTVGSCFTASSETRRVG